MLYLTGDHVMKRHFGFKKELEEAIIKKGLSNNVTFTGWRKDALSVLSVMDIFVLPSLREGVPKSILEAMALGKPVVATDVGGIAETVIDGETGFVVKPMDAGGLAKAILMLAKDKELRTRFGEKAREIAFRNYSIQEHIAKLEQFYMDIVHTNNFRN
jgi:glycosyltransferase involved in cell wall biosynthesis